MLFGSLNSRKKIMLFIMDETKLFSYPFNLSHYPFADKLLQRPLAEKLMNVTMTGVTLTNTAPPHFFLFSCACLFVPNFFNRPGVAGAVL